MQKISKANFSIIVSFFLVNILTIGNIFSQTQTNDQEEIYNVVDQMPEYPGDEGLLGMVKFLKENLIYPVEAKKRRITGMVYVQFIVNKTGELSEFIVKKGIGYGCDEEALRVSKLMPKWIPGLQNGKPVSVRMAISISFKLEK